MTGDGIKEKVKLLTDTLRPVKNEFDAIAMRGMSGALIAPSVAIRLNKDIIIVRKGEQSHSGRVVEGVECDNYIIIDDFIASGNTIESIINGIKNSKFEFEKSKLVGIAIYHPTGKNELQQYSERFGVWITDGSKTVYPRKSKCSTVVKLSSFFQKLSK